MTPYAAALFAARQVRENMPDAPSTGVIFQVVGPTAILTMVLTELADALALAETVAGLGTELVLVADAFHTTIAPDARVPATGELEARHAAGDPTTSEALIVAGMKRSEETARVTVMPYDRSSGEVRWSAPFQLHGVDAEGRIARGLAGALARTSYPDTDTAPLMAWAAQQMTQRGIGADVVAR